MYTRKHKSHVSHERWLVSYADFITLLFAFFVVLYATSQANKARQHNVAQAIDNAFKSLGLFSTASNKSLKDKSATGADDAEIPMNIVMGDDVMAPAQVKQDLEKLQHQMEQLLSDKVAQHTVAIHMGRDGLVISLREAGFFASGSAIPQPQTAPLLHRISSALNNTAYDLRIEGHTDNIPIHTLEFASNWELSSARATGIARILMEDDEMPPEKIAVAGYAEFHPVAPNDNAEGRSQNRRVDLVVIPKSRINFDQKTLNDLSANTGRPVTTNDTQWHRITDGDTPTTQ